MIIDICPGKDGDVKKLIFECQGKAGYFFGFESEVGSETNGWAGFRLGQKS